MALFNLRSLLLKRHLKRLFSTLRNLNEEIFACLLQQDYLDTRYLYERRIHTAKYQYRRAIKKFQPQPYYMNGHEKLFYQKVESLARELYAVMVAYGQLRYRITNQTAYLFCYAELTALKARQTAILENLGAMQSNKLPDIETATLIDAVEQLEDVYQSVLVAAVNEPLPFLIFITDVNYFTGTVASFHAHLVEKRDELKKHGITQ